MSIVNITRSSCSYRIFTYDIIEINNWGKEDLLSWWRNSRNESKLCMYTGINLNIYIYILIIQYSSRDIPTIYNNYCVILMQLQDIVRPVFRVGTPDIWVFTRKFGPHSRPSNWEEICDTGPLRAFKLG